jgi:hypothetical protein
MPMVPHNYNYFGAFTLLLNEEAVGYAQAAEPWAMPAVEAARYLGQLAEFVSEETGVMREAFSTPLVLQLLGGDPFSDIDSLIGLLEIGRANRWQCEVATTAYWATSRNVVSNTLDRLDGRISAIFIDTSQRLLDSIGLERVDHLISESRKRHLGVQIRCGVDDGSGLPMGLFGLDVMSSDTSLSQVIPMGDPANSALSYLSPAPPLKRRCAEGFAFTVIAGGDVYPCSRGAGMQGLRIGSLQNQSVADILAHVRPNQVLRHLRDQGPRSLYDTIRQGVHAGLLAPGYVDGCHFHRHVLGQPALDEIVRDPASYTR